MGNRLFSSRYNEYIDLGTSGKKEDVDFLMHALISRNDLATSKLVDYALSLVATREGIERLRHYLFNGLQTQRNYAALFFKRRGHLDVLDEAVGLGEIDREQAYAK